MTWANLIGNWSRFTKFDRMRENHPTEVAAPEPVHHAQAKSGMKRPTPILERNFTDPRIDRARQAGEKKGGRQ